MKILKHRCEKKKHRINDDENEVFRFPIYMQASILIDLETKILHYKPSQLL